MLKYYRYILGALCVVALYACNNGENKIAESEKIAKTEEVLKLEIDQLIDSMNTTWDSMMVSDDRKISDIKRLLKEISYMPRFDVIQHKKLELLADSLSGLRYNRSTMQNSALIDAYDDAQDRLIKGVITLAATTPEVEKFPLVSKLIDEIQEEDYKVVVHRLHYDSFAKVFNKTLNIYGEEVKKIGSTYADLNPFPIFELSN